MPKFEPTVGTVATQDARWLRADSPVLNHGPSGIQTLQLILVSVFFQINQNCRSDAQEK